MRFFMYKYKIQENDWYEFIIIIHKITDHCMLMQCNVNVQCDAAVIRELHVHMYVDRETRLLI